MSGPEGVALPSALVAAAEEEGRGAWLSSVPATVARFRSEWSLTIGSVFDPGGQTAWVAPARDADGAELVLKVAWRHPEAEHESAGLRVWAGAGAVILHAEAEVEGTNVLLLERCTPGTALSEQPELVQDQVIAGLLERLWVAAPDRDGFRPLQEMCDQWTQQFDAKQEAGKVTLDAGLAAAGIELFRTLPASAPRHVLLCTDLHAGNVLTAQREPWLVIDPKPYVGDPTYDVLQHLLNCPERLHDDPLGLVAWFADRLDLDRERLRLWLFARCVQESPDWQSLALIARKLAP